MALTFWQMITHFFPGLLVALALFLYLDLVSQKDLLGLAFVNPEFLFAKLTVFGIVGVIFGVIVDCFHHRFISRLFKFIQDRGSKARLGEQVPNVDKNGNRVRDTYYIGLLGVEKLNRIFEAYYYYSEFYVNLAIALFPLSVISVIYFRNVLCVSAMHLVLLSVLSLAVQVFLYWSAYVTLIKHHEAYRDAVRGALDFREPK